MAKKKKRCNARRDAVREYRIQHPDAKYTHAHLQTAPPAPVTLEPGPEPVLLVCTRTLADAGNLLHQAVCECISVGDDDAVADAEQLNNAANLTVWLATVLITEQTELAARNAMSGWGGVGGSAPSTRFCGDPNFGLQPHGPGALTRVRFGPEVAELLRWPAVGLPGFAHQYIDQAMIRAVGDLYDWALRHHR